jgi:hypothetical protein
MKLLFFLLSAATASTSHTSLSRQLIERHVQSNVDLQTLMDLQQSDWTCVMKGAMDLASCEDDNDDYNYKCAWCPLGSIAGVCVSADQADAVNGLEIPHLQCGADTTADDLEFWDDLVGCEMAGATYEDCLGNPLCTWCVVEEPAFGLCMSQESIDMANSLEDPEEPILMDDVLICSQEPPEPRGDNTEVTGLLDFNCILEGALGQQACADGVDGAGNLCVFQESELFGELCLSVTQTNVMDFLMETITSLGLDIDSLMGDMNVDVDMDTTDMDMTGMMAGADVEIDVIPQLYGVAEPAPEQEPLEVSTYGEDAVPNGEISVNEMASTEEAYAVPNDEINVNEAEPAEEQEYYTEEVYAVPNDEINVNEAEPAEGEYEYAEDEDVVVYYESGSDEGDPIVVEDEELYYEEEEYDIEMESAVGEEERAEERDKERVWSQAAGVPPTQAAEPNLAKSILASAVSNIAAGEDVVQEHTKKNEGGRRA